MDIAKKLAISVLYVAVALLIIKSIGPLDRLTDSLKGKIVA